jgi:hypothetical protein
LLSEAVFNKYIKEIKYVYMNYISLVLQSIPRFAWFEQKEVEIDRDIESGMDGGVGTVVVPGDGRRQTESEC